MGRQGFTRVQMRGVQNGPTGAREEGPEQDVMIGLRDSV